MASTEIGSTVHEVTHEGHVWSAVKDDWGFVVLRNGERVAWQIDRDAALRYINETSGIKPYRPEYNVV